MTVNSWIAANLVWISLAITILVLIYLVYVLIQRFKNKRAVGSQLSIILLILGLMFLIFLTYHADEIEGKDWGQIILMLGLVIVTALYASSTEKQAHHSVKMAKEMREQRVMASRPVIIQKAVHDDQSSHFEIYNTGNGTAIELQIILLDQWKKPSNGKREGFLRAGDTPIPFYTTFPRDVADSTFYIVSEYQGTSSYSPQPTWYQTWLPCKLSVSGRVIGGKLEFHDNVSEENRIGIFKSEFNNGSKLK
ncbi:potassium-transporting ATPase subunit F [Chloroflexota bacterium]